MTASRVSLPPPTGIQHPGIGALPPTEDPEPMNSFLVLCRIILDQAAAYLTHGANFILFGMGSSRSDRVAARLRVRLRGLGRDADPDRPGRRGPSVLLRQAQAARHEPAGHRQPRRRHLVGVRGAARIGARQEGRIGSGVSWPNWRPPAWSSWLIRATREARTPNSRTAGRTSPNPRSRPTGPTPNSAHPASTRTPSSKPGTSSASSAGAPGARVSSPRPSTYCRSARHNQDGKAHWRAA